MHRQLLTTLSSIEQVSAVEESQKYKEGKFILEKGKIMKVQQLCAPRIPSCCAGMACHFQCATM